MDFFRTILFNNCESEEEGTRSAVAECLGKLTMIDPPKYLPALQVWTILILSFFQKKKISFFLLIFLATTQILICFHKSNSYHCNQIYFYNSIPRVWSTFQIHYWKFHATCKWFRFSIFFFFFLNWFHF